MAGDEGGDLPPGLLYLGPEGPGGQAQGPVAQDDPLLHAVGGGHPHPVVLPQVIGGLFNVGVGGLRLFRIHHIDAAPPLHRAHAALHLIGVEDQNDLALAEGPVFDQKLGEDFTGGVHVLPGQGVEVVPGEDDVIPVHQQIFRLGPLVPDVIFFAETGAGRLFLWLEGGGALHRAIGLLEQSLKLLVLLQAAAPAV